MGKQSLCESLPSLTLRGSVDGERPRMVSILLTFGNMDLNCLGPLRHGLVSVVNTAAPHEWLAEPADAEPQIQGAGLNHVDFAAVWRVGTPTCCIVQGSAVYLGDNRCTLLSVGDASFCTSRGLWIRRLKRGPFPTSLERGCLAVPSM